VKHHKRSISRNLPDLPSASVNMIGRGWEPHRGMRASRGANSPSFSSPDPDYSPGLGQVLVEEEGVFRSTRSRVTIPYSYEQSSSSTGVRRGLNFGKGRRDFLRNFVPKGKPTNYNDKTRRELGYMKNLDLEHNLLRMDSEYAMMGSLQQKDGNTSKRTYRSDGGTKLYSLQSLA